MPPTPKFCVYFKTCSAMFVAMEKRSNIFLTTLIIFFFAEYACLKPSSPDVLTDSLSFHRPLFSCGLSVSEIHSSVVHWKRCSKTCNSQTHNPKPDFVAKKASSHFPIVLSMYPCYDFLSVKP